MDFLRSIGGMFASGIVRLLVIAGTLVLVYLLFVRPALDTTNKALDQFSVPDTSSAIQRDIRRQIRQSNRQALNQVPGQVRITRTVRGLTPRQARRLNRCVGRAGANVDRINRCFDRFSRK